MDVSHLIASRLSPNNRDMSTGLIAAVALLALLSSPSAAGQVIALHEAVRAGFSVEVYGTGTDACFGRCIAVHILSRSSSGYTIACERGTVLVPKRGTHQCMVVSRESRISVAAYSEATDRIYVYCREMEKLPPQDCRYDVADKLLDKREMILRELDQRGHHASLTGQYVYWYVEDGRRRDEVMDTTSGSPEQEQAAAQQAQDLIGEVLGPADADRFARSVPLPIPAIGGLTREQTMWAVIGGAVLLLALVIALARRGRKTTPPPAPSDKSQEDKEGGPPPPPRPRRPAGVTLLGVLYILGGIGSGLAAAAAALTLFAGMAFAPELSSLVLMIGVPGMVIGGVAALLGIVIGLGLLRVRRWARVMVMLLCAFGVIGSGLAALMTFGTGMFPVAPVVSGAIALVIVLYLGSAGVSKAFR